MEHRKAKRMLNAQQRQTLVEQISLRREISSRRRNWRLWEDITAGFVMGLFTLAASGLVVIITAMLIHRAWPILSTQSPQTLIFSETWHPTKGDFGFWPFITGSIAVTLVSMVLSVPAAIFSAMYLAEYTTIRSWIKPLVDLLASIPSVIYGLWGILFVVPLIRNHIGPSVDGSLGQTIPFFANDNPTGYGILAAGIVLALMVFPIIVSVTEEVFRSVPEGMREASLALGATEWETTKKVVLRKALPGVIAAVVLGFSRAFGETLAVLMVIGNVAKVPNSLFDPGYTLPALLANNYGEMMSIPLYDAALMASALMLLVVVLFFNIAARLILARVNRETAAS
jgi:phosphate transport system permease protein